MHHSIKLANSYFSHSKTNDISFLSNLSAKNYHLILRAQDGTQSIYAFHLNEIKLTDCLPKSAKFVSMTEETFNGILSRSINPIVCILNGQIEISK
jgi:hypothetical protein